MASGRTLNKPPQKAAMDVDVRLLSLQEEVHQRIASDLHDSTCQHLIAASLNMMRVRRALNDGDDAEKLCDDIDQSINQALNEIRAFTYLLHPQNLLRDGLKATIEQFVDGFSARTSLQASLEITSEVDKLSYDRQRAVLRVIQEALTNVFRHAKATQVEVSITATPTHFRLRVSDDGRGMPVGQAEVGPQSDIGRGRNSGDESQIAADRGRSRNPFLIDAGTPRHDVVCGNSAHSPAQASAIASTASSSPGPSQSQCTTPLIKGQPKDHRVSRKRTTMMQMCRRRIRRGMGALFDHEADPYS